jgi:sugar phosphate isomerase/epimerase
MDKFILTGFSDEIDVDFLVQLREIKKLGIGYIEIRGVNGKNITDHTIEEVTTLKKQLDEAGVKVSAIGSPIGKINIEDDFKPHFELFKHTVEIAKILQTSYIRLFSFFMDTTKADAYRDEVMRRMTMFKDYVEGSDIILLHENEKEIYGDTPERCLDIYKMLASENVKLIFDPANFVQCHVETYPHAFNLLKDHVIYYHIKDALNQTGEVVPAGFGDGHVKEIIAEINQRGYQGFLSLEPHLGHFEGFDSLEGDGEIPEFKENSDVGKFILAADSLNKILVEVTNG